jgi:hypothetical protein
VRPGTRGQKQTRLAQLRFRLAVAAKLEEERPPVQGDLTGGRVEAACFGKEVSRLLGIVG